MMEAVRTSETSVNSYLTTRRYIPETLNCVYSDMLLTVGMLQILYSVQNTTEPILGREIFKIESKQMRDICFLKFVNTLNIGNCLNTVLL
jgi:hypothetical protein